LPKEFAGGQGIHRWLTVVSPEYASCPFYEFPDELFCHPVCITARHSVRNNRRTDPALLSGAPLAIIAAMRYFRNFVARRLTACLLGGLSFCGVAAWTLWPVPAPPNWIADYDVSARPAETIPPSTVIDRAAPVGWSHLVIKGVGHIRPEHRERVSDFTARMAGWMFTAFFADVRCEGSRHYLRAVALGLGTAINGHDMIVTPETPGIGWVGRTLLTKGYDRQRQTTVAVHGPTLALVDTPTWFRCGDKNKLIRFRYALLVDVLTGRLDVLVWALECGRDEMVLLEPNTIDEVELLVDRKEFTLGVPSEAAFAVDRLPRGRAIIAMPPELRPLLRETHFTPQSAAELEIALRQLLP
jgi:hypothetical protein